MVRMPGSQFHRSLVIENLRLQTEAKGNTAVVCAYCRFDDDCNSENILRGFIHQFLAQHPSLLPRVSKYYKKYRLRRTGPSIKDIIEMLQALVDGVDVVHIVVDGLNEITNDKDRVSLLQELHKLPARTLIFSRPLDLHARHLPSATVFSIEARDNDIESFVMSSLLNHTSLHESIAKAGLSFVQDIATRIKERCRGM